MIFYIFIDDFKRVTTFFQDIPRGKRITYLTQNVFRRAMHSFINNENEEYSLKGISPGFDRAHHYINTFGKIILPSPDRLRLTENVPSLIPDNIFKTKLKKLGIKNYLNDSNQEEDDEHGNDVEA
jgi:hypothetical protein